MNQQFAFDLFRHAALALGIGVAVAAARFGVDRLDVYQRRIVAEVALLGVAGTTPACSALALS